MAPQGRNIGTYPMISMHNVVVNGGTFTNQNIGARRKPPFDILKDAVAYRAFHNSLARFDPPRCHPNTRIAVLNKIMNWMQRCDSETRDHFVMWLTGAAGAGKSAIAQSFIELCLQLDDIFIASFFFGRSDGTRNHGDSLVATLVYQIFELVPGVREEILTLIDADPFILTRSLEHQFIELIAKPLKKLDSPGTPWSSVTHRIIVIDGLDECLNKSMRQHILRIISKAIQEFNLPILFLIVSRPEHDINVTFGSPEMDSIYTRLYLDDTYAPDKDIRLFLRDSFEDIRLTHPFRTLIRGSWPSSSAVDSIVQKASGQFIYAATVVRFVQSICHHPHHRLEIVMNLRPAHHSLPFAQLDALYTMILSSAEDVERVLYVLSIYSHQVIKDYNYRDFDISKFLSLEDGELDILFCDIQAIVSIECNESHNHQWNTVSIKGLKILHASLHDFLLDPTRSKDYFLDLGIYRTEHLANILHYLGEPDLSTYAMELRASSVEQFFAENFARAGNSSKLIRYSASFPLVKAIQTANTSWDRSLYGFSATNEEMMELISYSLLPYFRHMALRDETWSLIESRQHDALDELFRSKIEGYYKNNNLTLLLCIVFHAGKTPLVPFFQRDSHDLRITPYHGHLYDSIWPRDELGLAKITLKENHIHNDQYRHCIIRFLQDSIRSGSLSIGPAAYTVATLAVVKILHLLELPEDSKDLFDEGNLSNLLVFEKENWRLGQCPNIHCDHLRHTDFESCFQYLGYFIFFLPGSLPYSELIRHCREQTFLTSKMETYFPERIKLVRKAIEEYLGENEDRTPSTEEFKTDPKESSSIPMLNRDSGCPSFETTPKEESVALLHTNTKNRPEEQLSQARPRSRYTCSAVFFKRHWGNLFSMIFRRK